MGLFVGVYSAVLLEFHELVVQVVFQFDGGLAAAGELAAGAPLVLGVFCLTV